MYNNCRRCFAGNKQAGVYDNPSLESRVGEGFPEKIGMNRSEDIRGQSVLSVEITHAKALG